MQKSAVTETINISVVERDHKKLFKMSTKDATYHTSHIPVGVDFAGGHIEARSGDKIVADFGIFSANTGVIMASTDFEPPQIVYLDGLLGQFKIASAVGTSNLEAKDLSIGDTVKLTAPSAGIEKWLSTIQATAQTQTKKHGVYDPADWAYLPKDI